MSTADGALKVDVILDAIALRALILLEQLDSALKSCEGNNEELFT